MAVNNKLRHELWVAWTHDAVRLYEPPDDIDDDEDFDLVGDMASFAAEYADAMVQEHEDRADGGKTGTPAGRRRGRKKTKRNRREESDDDDDDDDDDD